MSERMILLPKVRRIFLTVCVSTMLAAIVLHSCAHAETVGAHRQPIKLPKRYRDWQLISVAHEEGDLHDIRGILANEVAAKAFRSNAAVFPNGSKIVRIAWRHTASPENDRAFGREQSFVAGAPTNIQLMVRNTKQYAATAGWGYAQFATPDAANEVARPEICSACHQSAKDHGHVFTRYSR